MLKSLLPYSPLLLLLAACGQTPPPASAPVSAAKPAAQFRPTASIQELMASIVDPAADAVWDAVSSETTKQGIVEHQPRTEAEWQAVRQHAITLLEASNLLVMEGRTVSHTLKLEDAHVPGILTPPEVQKKIDADHAAFAQKAHALHDAGAEALAAIDAKNPQRLLAAGEKIDQACERCHMVYWYPNAEQPKWPAPLAAR